MAKLQLDNTKQPAKPTTAKWEQRLAGPDTIHKLMEGKVKQPTLTLLINTPSAVGALNSNNPASSRKIMQVASAWNLFLKSPNPESLEAARPPFIRFIDAIETAIEHSENPKHVQEMLTCLSFPNIFAFDFNYILNKFYRIFSAHPTEEKGRASFAHLEHHAGLLHAPPGDVNLRIVRGMLEFYEQNPNYLRTIESSGTARSLANLLFSHKESLLRTNADLVAFGIAWATIESKDRIAYMGSVADTKALATQTVLFTKILDLIPLLTVTSTKSTERFSERFMKKFPEMQQVLTNDLALTIAEEVLAQERVVKEAKRILRGTGLHFMAVSSEGPTLH